jgi:hypothetical protein
MVISDTKYCIEWAVSTISQGLFEFQKLLVITAAIGFYFEILALVQHEKEVSTWHCLLVPSNTSLINWLALSLYMIILYELQGKDHGLDI